MEMQNKSLTVRYLFIGIRNLFDVINIFGLGKLERFGQNVKKIIFNFFFIYYIWNVICRSCSREKERCIIKLSILTNSCNANDVIYSIIFQDEESGYRYYEL